MQRMRKQALPGCCGGASRGSACHDWLVVVTAVPTATITVVRAWLGGQGRIWSQQAVKVHRSQDLYS
eukprot:SM000215S06725  [mRNA]  locus=s215:110655:111213:+ [translate_table: standard]